MTSMTQEERRADTRERLLRAAADLFARKGVDAVSVDAIADEAGRTSGALYDHFGGKQGLVAALVDTMRNELAAVIGGESGASDDPERRIDALWRNFADHPDTQGGLWLLLEHELWLRAARDPELQRALAARYAAGRKGMARAFGAWDVDPAVPPKSLPPLVLALLLGLEMQRRLDPSAVPDHVARAGLAALFGIDLD
jgi:AcrR family transcriptional regulator